MVAVPKRSRSKREAFLSEAEAWQILDEQARASLGMSGAEFVRVWKAGEIDDPDRPEIMHLAMLLPFEW